MNGVAENTKKRSTYGSTVVQKFKMNNIASQSGLIFVSSLIHGRGPSELLIISSSQFQILTSHFFFIKIKLFSLKSNFVDELTKHSYGVWYTYD